MVNITRSRESFGITVVEIDPEILTDHDGKKWRVAEFSCCNNGNYWTGHGLMLNKNGKIGGRYSKSIVLDIPQNVRDEAVKFYV